jgi:DNA repair protein RecN (Recombination protein N)
LLQQLELSQLATFEEARLGFSEGLNIVSGMSGAGKSVLLQALKLSLGGRFSQKLMREGASEAEVRALYVLNDDLCEKYKEELGGIEEVLVRRVFRREGRTVNYINDKMVSLDLLSRLGADVAKVLSQDEALGLKDPEEQLKMLDIYGGLTTMVSDHAKLYSQWVVLGQEIKGIEGEVRERSQKEEFYRFQFQELESLNLEGDELSSLEEEVRLLSSASEISHQMGNMLDEVDACVSRMDAPLAELKSAIGEVEAWSSLLEEGVDLKVSLYEWARACRDQLGEVEADPQRLSIAENRLLKLRGACKRFGMSEEELLAYQEDLRSKLDAPPIEVALEGLREKRRMLELDCKRKAKLIHEKRQSVAKKLACEVNELLGQLEMSGDRFDIELKVVDLVSSGVTEVTFMLRPTAEASFNPLHEAASGGERSRALLGISSALRASMGCSMLVFDEVDTNIGSRLGKPISDAFRSLASAAQVICVTHLAPVAASGDEHYVVEKGRRDSVVRQLDDRERVSELAHMIAGERDSSAAESQAREMLSHYHKRFEV